MTFIGSNEVNTNADIYTKYHSFRIEPGSSESIGKTINIFEHDFEFYLGDYGRNKEIPDPELNELYLLKSDKFFTYPYVDNKNGVFDGVLKKT